MAHDETRSAIETLLKLDFVSDPRQARFAIPKAPAKAAKDRPFPHPAKVITPEMARDWLKHRAIRLDRIPKQIRHDEMVANRRFLITSLEGSSRSKGLIRVLQDSEWNPRIATPIVFTYDGFLLDGQHRLAACAISGVDIEVPVTTNGFWDTFSVTDTGRGRTAGQLLGDVPYPDYSAATAKLILSVIDEVEAQEWSVTDATNQDIYDLVHGWPFFHESYEDSGTWMSQVVSASRSRIPLVPLAASTMMALAAGADPFHVASFLDGLRPGYNGGFPDISKDGGKDPRFLLRRSYLTKTVGKRKVGDKERREQVGHVRRAMSVWLEFQGGFSLDKLKALPTIREDADLPPVWRAENVRKFHREKVS